MKPIYHKIKILGIITVIGISIYISACDSTPRYKGSQSAESKQAIISRAKKMLGVKYRYGGTSPNSGFDCSGLVQYSYKAAGISLPRTTRQQYKSAKWIARKYLKAGDLVFFKTTPSRHVSHVGIYLENSKFIHAPSSGERVKISSMKEKYWRKRFIGAGRTL